MDKVAQNVTISLSEQKFNVLKFTGIEEIFKPYKFNINILVNGNTFNADNYILIPATLHINDRSISGIITQCKTILLNMEGNIQVSITLEPRLMLANLSQNVRVILNQSVPEIIRKILINLGYSKQQIKFHLSENYIAKPYRMQVQKETDLEFFHRLLAKSGIYYWIDFEYDTDSCFEVIHFSDNSNYLPHIEPIINYIPLSGLTNNQQTIYDLHQQYSSEAANIPISHKLIAKSDLSNIKTGYTVALDSKRSTSTINGDYIVERINHYFEQNIEQQGKDTFYHNELLLHPRKTPIRIPISNHPKLATIFQAHIESNGNYALLNENGNYCLRQKFDLSDTPNASASPPLPRLAPYGGEPNTFIHRQVGWHMPLRNGAEVLVSTINGDPDRPIIISTVPNNNQISPVTVINKTQNLLRTASDNQLLIDDTITKPKIQVNTYDKHNLLELNADPNNPQINLTADQGAIEWRAKQTLQMQSGDTTNEYINKDRIQNVEQNHKTHIKNQDIHYQSGGDHQLLAKNNLYLQSTHNIELTSNNSLNLQAKNNLYLTVKGEHTNCYLKNGNLYIQSGNNITIAGDGNGDMEFTQNGVGFKIAKTGSIEIFGKAINGFADAGINLKGNINYITSAAQIPAPLNIPNLITPRTIEDLTSTQAEQQAQTCPENCKFNDEYLDKFTSFLQTLTNTKWVTCGKDTKNCPIKFAKDRIEIHDDTNRIIKINID
jgi:type VI secretion system secreted protein VgrG